jgi:uncharacterized Zn finger protein
MGATASIDYSCPNCGKVQTYQLVPMETSEPDQHTAREAPSIDLGCLRCGTVQTYQLVPLDTEA